MTATDDIRWVFGDRRHRAALSRFVCTDPPRAAYDRYRGRFHPRPWELDGQSGLRGLTPSLSTSDRVLLGLDNDDEVAAVCRFSPDTAFEQLLVLALTVRSDLQGRGLATETLRRTLVLLAQVKVRHRMDCGIWARIHSLNVPSKRLFESAGFEALGVVGDSGLEVWVRPA